MRPHAHLWKLFILDLLTIEFAPVAVFVLAYHLSDFPRAALALCVTTFLTLVLSYVVNARVPWFALSSGCVTMLTSYVTYRYDLPGVLIAMDSAYYFLFASALGIGAVFRLHLFRTFFGHVFAITERGWRILERRWLCFFVFAGATNELVRIYLTYDEWVVYKQGMVLLFLTFGLYQFRVSSTHRTAEGDRRGLRLLVGKATHAEAGE